MRTLYTVAKRLKEMYEPYSTPPFKSNCSPRETRHVYTVYDPTKGPGNGHDLAVWLYALETLKEKVRKAGYTNPTIVEYKGWALEIMVDEDDEMYTGFFSRREGLCDIAQHTGLGLGCGSGSTAQLRSYNRFLSEGLDESHGWWSWSNFTHQHIHFVCPKCFPAKHAEQQSADRAAGTNRNDSQVGRRHDKVTR